MTPVATPLRIDKWYALGLSCLFATLGGLFFWRAARHFPEELSRNLAKAPVPRADNACLGGVV